MAAASEIFPTAVIQHEDFYSEAAFAFLDRYKLNFRMFNDDIEGYVSLPSIRLGLTSLLL